MTTTYHTPITTGAAANAATFNTVYSQLDSRLVQIDNTVDTDGTIKAGAVDNSDAIANAIVTDVKLSKPIRLAYFGIAIGATVSSIAAHSTSTTTWNIGLTEGNFAMVSRAESYTTEGVVWDAWLTTEYYIKVRGTNVTASTVNLNALTVVIVAVLDLQGDLGESTESLVT